MEKAEILRCNNINKTSKYIELKNIYLDICEDEFISFYGLNDQTIPSLISIMSDKVTFDKGSIYYAPKYHPSACKIDSRLFRNTRMIKDLSIAENLGIVSPNISPFTRFSSTKNGLAVAEVFSKFSLDYDPTTTLIKLNMIEIYILEILHIYINGGTLIYLMDFYLFNEAEQNEILDKILIPLKKIGIIFIFVNYSITPIMYNSDRIFIFNEGRLCKTLYKGEFSIRDLNNIFASENYSDSMLLNYKKRPYSENTDINNLGHSIPLDISKISPQITGLFLNNYSTQNIKDLSIQTRFCSLKLDLLTFNSSNPELLIKNKIYVISDDFEKQLFSDLSIHENITITKLKELSYLKTILNMHFYQYLIQSRRKYTLHLNINQAIENRGHYDCFCTLLDRIYLAKANLVIINFPHSFCDSKELSLLESFIECLKSENIHVILLSDNHHFLQKCSDNVIICTSKKEPTL